MISDTTIEEVKKRLVATYNPVEIYIFGSYAWGLPEEDSDLDLLVILEECDLNRYSAIVKGHKALLDLDLAKDILLLTKKEFEAYSADPRRIYYRIKQKGKKIYARAAP